MGMMTFIKVQKAVSLQGKGNEEEALALYRECWKQGMDDPRTVLAFAVLLMRHGAYEQARSVLVKLQNNPRVNREQKLQLYIDYAVCAFRMGEIDKAVHVLESRIRDGVTGMLYDTLGYLYVEQLEQAKQIDPETWFAKNQKELIDKRDSNEAVQFPDITALLKSEATGSETQEETEKETPPELTPLQHFEVWYQAQIEKARCFIEESIEYDDEDSIALDNMGQFLYRILDDKASAREWFNKAIEIKPLQKDTLWFLSRYDLDEGNTEAACEKLQLIKETRISPLNYVTAEMIEKESKRLQQA